MGYYMDLVDSNFWIKKENEEKALNAIKEAVADGRVNSWINKEFVEKANDLQDAFLACRWDIEKYDDNNGYGDLYFDGEKLGNDYEFFCAIAPYVGNNCYVQIRGEDGEMWRWVFRDGKCHEIYPTIIWD